MAAPVQWPFTHCSSYALLPFARKDWNVAVLVLKRSVLTNLGCFTILAVITLFAYAPVRQYGFVNFDDPEYITHNPNVIAGLTWRGTQWAFTTGYQSNWHPLTWLSHMMDVQLFGLNAGAHHATNVLFHIANALLLFWLLVQMSGRAGPSAFVAVLFALHPLHVESVAWVSERKDVLSTFFGLLTLYSYAKYARRPGLRTYSVVAGSFVLGLIAKPMLVTLPFVLLLLDFWPLGRFTAKDLSRVPPLILEKIPLVILAGISSLITFFVQRAGGSVSGADIVPVTTRVANAFVDYFSYIARMLWPDALAVLYPVHLTAQDGWWAAALALVGLSIVALWAARRWPYVPVGWFWYLVTLVPVVGLIQVGRQATADRYTYIPLIGLFLIIAFGGTELLSRFPAPGFLSAVAMSLTVVVGIWATRTQVQYWSNSETLWRHTLTVTEENSTAHFNLASALMAQIDFASPVLNQSRVDEAFRHYAEAVRIDPTLRLKPEYAVSQYDLANLILSRGRNEQLDEAAAHLSEALLGKPDFPEAHNALGIIYLTQGQMDKARSQFFEAIRLKPGYAGAHNNLGTAFGNQGLLDEAISEYGQAVRLDPGLTDAHINLGILLAKQGKRSDAIHQFNEVLRVDSNNSEARARLADLTVKHDESK